MFLKGLALLQVLDLFKDLRTLGRKESPTIFNGLPSGSAVKNPPAMQGTQEMQVQSRGEEDPMEKEMTIHSSILAWRIPQTEESGRLQGSQRVGHNWRDWSCLVFNNFWFPFHDIILEVPDWAMNRNIPSFYLHNTHFRFHHSVMFCFQSYSDI